MGKLLTNLLEDYVLLVDGTKLKNQLHSNRRNSNSLMHVCHLHIVQEQGLKVFDFGDTQYAQGLTSDYYRGDPGACP